MKDSLTEFGYILGWRVTRLMPEQLAAAVFRAGADKAYASNGRGVQQLRRNLRRVVGPTPSPDELDALTKDAMRSYARYWLEAFRLPSYSTRQLRDRFRFDHWDVLARNREQGLGTIIALAHSGNWDLAGAAAGVRGWSVVTVAERLKPEGVYQKFLKFRRGLGMEILPYGGGEGETMAVLEQRLRDRSVVPLLADRDMSGKGVEAKFFGETITMPAGPAMLAMRTRSPLYTLVLHNDGPKHSGGVLEGPIEIPTDGDMSTRIAAITQSIADNFAAKIAQQPQDWHMLQRLWLSDMPTE